MNPRLWRFLRGIGHAAGLVVILVILAFSFRDRKPEREQAVSEVRQPTQPLARSVPNSLPTQRVYNTERRERTPIRMPSHAPGDLVTTAKHWNHEPWAIHSRFDFERVGELAEAKDSEGIAVMEQRQQIYFIKQNITVRIIKLVSLADYPEGDVYEIRMLEDEQVRDKRVVTRGLAAFMYGRFLRKK